MHLLSKQIGSNKLVMGIPTFGRTFVLKNAQANGIGAPIAGLGSPGEFTHAQGLLSYYEVCTYLQDDWR